MKRINIKTLKGYESFIKECQFFSLESEYPGWTGKESFGIITDQEEETLIKNYPEIMNALKPYLLLSKEYGEIRKDSECKEREYRRWKDNNETRYCLDEESVYHHPELIGPDCSAECIEKADIKRALEGLTDIQRNRICKYYFLGKTISEISKEEGTCEKAIRESMRVALKKMRNSLEDERGKK